MSGFGAVGGIISAGIGAIMQNEANRQVEKRNDKALEIQKKIADQNLEFQKEQYDYQKELNDKTFNYQKELNDLTMAREDNAVWRRVQDLKAAGLNPVLAAGSDASSASFSVSNQRAGTAPQLDSSHFGAWAQRSIENAKLGLDSRMAFMNLALDFIRQKADISRSAAETKLINERAETLKSERPFNLENMGLANSFLKQSIDVDLEQKYANLSRTKKEELLTEKKAILMDKDIDYEEVRYLNGLADYFLKGKQADQLDKQLVVMDSLIKARKMEYDINKWNYDYYKERGLPTTYRDPSEVKLFKSIMGELHSDILDPISRWSDENNRLDRDFIDRQLDNYYNKFGHSFHNFAPRKYGVGSDSRSRSF